MLYAAVTVAALLVVAMVVAVAVPSAQDWARSWLGLVILALLTLLGYGTAVGILGAPSALGVQFRGRRWLSQVVATAPILFVLLLRNPSKDENLVPGYATWVVLALSLIILKAASAEKVPWSLRCAALIAPSWLLAVVGGLHLAASNRPDSVYLWLFRAQVGVTIAGVVVIPAILIVESIDALSGEGWIGRWLAPETYGRAWAALAVKAVSTTVLILLLAGQGAVLGGWMQSAIVAAVVLLLLVVESYLPFNDLRRGAGLMGRLRTSITIAMGSVGVIFGGYLLLLAFLRPLALVGMASLFAAANFVPASLARRGGQVFATAVAACLAAWGWASGPSIGPEPSPDVLESAVWPIVIVFVGMVLAQVFLCLRARRWGFPILVLAIAVGTLTQLHTLETPHVVPVNILVLTALVLALILGRLSGKPLVDPGEVIRWCLLSVLAIDLTFAVSMTTGIVQAGVLALTLLILGSVPLILNDRGLPRVRAAGLVCAIFTALLATVATGVFDELEALAGIFFWIIAFPVSAALSAASARDNLDGSLLMPR